MASLLSMLEKTGATIVGLADGLKTLQQTQIGGRHVWNIITGQNTTLGIETVTVEVNKYQPPKTVTITIEDCIRPSGTPKWGVEWRCSDGRHDKYGVEKSKQPDKLKVAQDIINAI